jgi:tetratricopeptide (TPR) repeat protein
MSIQIRRALMLIEQKRYELAERELGQALIENPDYALAHSLLANCLIEREAYDEATREAELGVHLAPNEALMHYTLANVLNQRNRLPEAERAINEAIRIDPHDADVFAMQSNIRMQRQQWAGALEAAEHGLAVDAEHVGCNNMRAMALVKLGRKAEAGATIDAALARNPDDAVSHANQGWTLLERNQPEKAMEHFREALRLDPNLQWARLGIVEALKARHLVYGLMLRYFLWMMKYSSRAQWGIVIGGYVGYQILGAITRSNPTLALIAVPLMIAYVLFAWMTWLASPFFNLLLRVNRFGRLALSDDERQSSNLVGGALLLAIVLVVMALVVDRAWLLFGGICSAMLMLPLSAIHRCERGWPRKAMIGYTALLAVVGAMASHPFNVDLERRTELLGLFAVGIFVNSFVANYLIGARVKH